MMNNLRFSNLLAYNNSSSKLGFCFVDNTATKLLNKLNCKVIPMWADDFSKDDYSQARHSAKRHYICIKNSTDGWPRS